MSGAPAGSSPLIVSLFVFAALLGLVGDALGKWSGPISAVRKRWPGGQNRQTAERDRRVHELEQTVDIVDGQVQRLLSQVAELTSALHVQQRLSDAQGRAITRHVAWDNQWAPRARAAGIDVPDPPDLYVYIEETP